MSNVDFICFVGENRSHDCGYCHQYNSNSLKSAFQCQDLHPQTYQDLMNRGWRRCGTYYYKMINNEVCCPAYTIRCNTKGFCLRKSQKKVLKTFKNYLQFGTKPKNDIKPKVYASGDNVSTTEFDNSCKPNNSLVVVAKKSDKTNKAKYKRFNLKLEKLKLKSEQENIDYQILLKEYQERRAKRLSKNKSKSLASLLDYSGLSNLKNTLEIKTVKCHPMSPDFQNVLNEEFNVYFKYQISIHKDKPDELSMSSFKRFLVKGGLIGSDSNYINMSKCENEFPQGQFHQQYWLNGTTLIAVGVLDILPNCVSSVYLFYDPDYSFLNLGVYSALHEINFVNKLSKLYKKPDFHHYYMGFYIHSCPKMKYKGQYLGSELACPESYHWVPISECQKILNKYKYARFANINNKDQDSFNDLSDSQLASKLLISYNDQMFTLKDFKVNRKPFLKFARLVGSKVLPKIAHKFS